MFYSDHLQSWLLEPRALQPILLWRVFFGLLMATVARHVSPVKFRLVLLVLGTQRYSSREQPARAFHACGRAYTFQEIRAISSPSPRCYPPIFLRHPGCLQKYAQRFSANHSLPVFSKPNYARLAALALAMTALTSCITSA